MSAIWESANWTRQFGIPQTGNRQFGMLPFTYPHILHTGKKVRLQIRIDHKMFDIFTSRKVKKNLLISTLTSDHDVRPNCRTFWEEYVGPESMIFDTLGVYCTCKIEEVFRGKYK